ncbi:unknown [Prevotella sp. CAG:1092]|nr:unknown [Prevotella sp. CAG:1092]
MLERIAIVCALRVEDGNSRRHHLVGHMMSQHLVGHMMVADDEVDTLFLGVRNLVDSFDAAVEDYNKLHTLLFGIVDTLAAHSVALFIAVRNVVFDVGIELLQELVYQSHSGTSVYIVVAIDEYTLLASHSIV